MAAGLLPPEFGPLPDGSRIVLDGGEVYDSLRGRRGAFLPVADVPVDKVTQAEVAEYNKFADFYRAQWGRMDPIIAGVKRNAAEGQPRASGGRRADEPVRPAALRPAEAMARPGRRPAAGADPRRHGRAGPGADRSADFRRPARRRARRPRGGATWACFRWDGSATFWWATSARPATWAC